MRFADVIGQRSVKERLVAMEAEGRVPHAMLFLGSEGAGALPLALAWTQYLCCESKTDGDSCGVCPACRKIDQLTHPDVHSIFPIVKTGTSDDADTYLPDWRKMVTTKPYFSLKDWTNAMGAKKGAASADDDSEPTSSGKQALISKTAALAIHSKLSMKPYEAGQQFLILWKPELMNETTSNAILKILEEPPANTLFFLVSEDTTSILPTILSRTQIFKVPPIADEDMAPELMRRFGYQDNEARTVAHNAQGNYVRALNLAEGDTETEMYLNLFKQMMRNAWKRDVVAMNGNAEAFRGMTREQVKNALVYFQSLVRESFIMNLGHPELNFTTDDERAFLQNFAPFVHVNNVEKLSELIDETYNKVAQNGNIKMLMKSMILQLTALVRNSKRPTASE